MSSIYDVGDKVRLSATFLVGNTFTDPTEVTLKVCDPLGSISSYVYNGGAGAVVKEDTGAFYYDLTVTRVGAYEYKWYGTGAATGAEEARFLARFSPFES